MREAALAALLSACSPPPEPPACPAPEHTVEGAFAEAYEALATCCRDVDVMLFQDSTGPLAAVAFMPGLPPILTYDRAELKVATKRYGYAAVIGVMAHELGHVIDTYDGKDVEAPGAQDSADAWAGCALRVLGYPVEPFERMSKAQRGYKNAAARDGYKLCKELAGK